METQLHGAQQRTFDAIFQHPIARNLAWREVCSMLDSMSDVVQDVNGRALKLSRNGRMVILHRPERKNFSDVQELMGLREWRSLKPHPLLVGSFARSRCRGCFIRAKPLE